MGCYHPIPAYQDRPGAPVKLWPPVGTATNQLPCGKCIGCRTDHATDWAHRAQYEAAQWSNNVFLTLTYDDAHLPEGGHLSPRDLRNFIKRLRQAARRRVRRREPTITSIQPTGPRYLASGEYGEINLRPHFHLLLFNRSFTDAKKVGKDLSESATVTRLWKLGGHRLGQATPAAANYVAQYSLKKLGLQGGGYEEDEYGGIHFVERHDHNGQIYQTPFLRASTVPPIGYAWTAQNKEDLQHGYLILNARKKRIPRAIKKQLKQIDPQLAEQCNYNAARHKRTQHDLAAAERIHEDYQRKAHKRQP